MLYVVTLAALCVSSVFAQGQDYFFNSAGQQPRYLAYQQPSLQHNSQQQLNNFFSSQQPQAFEAFRTSPSQSQSDFQPVQPSQYQFPPSRPSSLQHFDTFSARPASPTQFVHTNQHLPQPFQHFQSQDNNAQRLSFDVFGQSRFQNGPTIQKPTFQSQLQDAFIGVQNSEDETGRTTQSYVNVQHPQGDSLAHNRWKQVQSSINSPPVVESKRKRPSKVVQENDLALNSFIDQNLDDESVSRTAASSSPVDAFTRFQDKKKEEQESRRKLASRIQPTKQTEHVIQKPVKNLQYPRGTPAIPKTTARPELTSEQPYRITTLRSKYNEVRIKPTTYTPPAPSSLVDKRQKNRTPLEDRLKPNHPISSRFSTTTARPVQENVSLREISSEFGRPIAKKKPVDNFSPAPRTPWRAFPSPVVSSNTDHNDNPKSNQNTNHNDPEEEIVEYEYSSELSDSDGPTGFDEAYEEVVDDSSPSSIPQEAAKVPLEGIIIEKPSGKKNSSFDVLTMSHDHTLVSDENFRDFVDSASIDTSDHPADQNNESVSDDDESDKPQVPNKNTVVTTQTSKPKEVLKPKLSDSTTESSKVVDRDQVKAPPSAEASKPLDEEEEHPTESWVIVASVQTSRSVSGARFLPGSVTQQESPKSLVSKASVTKEDNSTITTSSSVNVSTSEVETPKDIPVTVKEQSVKEEVITSSAKPASSAVPSTESIIDKLDRVQSELSSGILSGGFRPDGSKLRLDLDVLPEMTSENSTSTTSASTSTSTTTTTTTTTPEPTTVGSPVFIRKFSPSNRKTTVRPRPSPKTTTKKPSLIDSIQFDELTGLLPPGFKPRGVFTPKKGITTTTESASEMQGDEPEKPHYNSSRAANGRSSDTSGTPNKINTVNIASFLPPGYKPPSENKSETNASKPKGIEGILNKVKFQDVSSLLPPGFKPNKTTTHENKSKEVKIPKISFDAPESLLPPGFKPKDGDIPKPEKIDISALLPPGFKPKDGDIPKPEKIDITALLPPGFKLTTEDPKEASTSVLDTILNKVHFKDVSALLPPGFKANETSSSTEGEGEVTTVPGAPKVVFPSRPGGGRKAPSRGSSSSKSAGGIGPVQPKIQKGWPTRATTEFTGWPSPSTTPISIEKILAAAKAAASTSTTEENTPSTTTTTTTTTTTPAPTTPGVCTAECDLAATIKLVGGAKWVPELLDHNTQEWQTLANEVRDQLETVYSSSEALSRWYKKITIDAFNEGSVLVDYFVELTDLGRTVNTADMRRLFHEALKQSTVDQEALAGGDTLQAHNASQFKMGKFLVDPKSTDFVVLPKQMAPTVLMAEEDVLLPQWAIAVIVIGLASLLFVIIFGVTVLVNRHNSAKKKQPVALTEDMLHELNKNHMGGLDNYGADDLYNMEDVWNDKPTKKRSSGSLHENSMANLYDSWRSEWNGYYFNAYYGGAGGNGGGSSSGYGRRRSDYDTNF